MTLDLTSSLKTLVEGHGIAISISASGDLVFGNGVKFSPIVVSSVDEPGGKLIQLDVRVESPALGDRLLIESFAGYKVDDSKAALDALGKFSQSSLHVLLAVLCDERLSAVQVEWEVWKNRDKQRRVCLGPLFLQRWPPTNDHANSTNISVVYGEFLVQLKEKLLPILNDEIHWLRIFFMKNGHDIVGSESLLDNADWTEGRRFLDSWPWPDGKYSVRHFLMLVPQI